MSRAPLTPQRPQIPYPVENTLSPSAGILTPTSTWSLNFTTLHTPSSFPAHPTTHSPSTAFQTFPIFNSQHGSATASHSRKRKQASDENLLVFGSLDSSAKKRKCPLSLKAKISIVLSAIKNNANWSFSDFLFHVFLDRDGEGKLINREHSHANIVQAFLSGRTSHTPGEILEIWWHHKDGRLDRDSDLMYSTSTPFSEIKPVRPALTSFAIQKVKEKVVREAKKAVLPLSGLHATTSDRSTRKASWVDIGATAIPDVANVLRTKQPITWHLSEVLLNQHLGLGRGSVLARPGRSTAQSSSDASTRFFFLISFPGNQQVHVIPEIAEG